MEKLISVIDKIVRALLAILFGIVSFCVLVQIIARYTPPEVLTAPWTDEMTRLFFLYTVMLGAPWAILYHSYASIDVIAGRLKGRTRVLLDIFVDLVIIVVAVVGIPQANLYFGVGQVSKSTSLQINLGLFYVVPLVIFTLTVLCGTLDIWRNVKKLRGGNEA